MNGINNELSRIIALGERYFDCTLSDREEEELRIMLAHTSLSHPAIDELRAMTGFRHCRAVERGRSKGRLLRAVGGIAAAVAVVLTLMIGLSRPYYSGDSDSTCVAYANGMRITDEDEVLVLLMADMRDFRNEAHSSAESFQHELGDVARLINGYESMNPEI